MANTEKSVLSTLGDLALDAGKGFLNTITGGLGGTVLGWLTGNNKNDDYNRQIKLMQEQQKQAFELMDRQANWNEHFTNLAYQQQENMFNLEKNENRYLRNTAMEAQAQSMDRAGLNRNLLSGTVGAGSSSAPSVPSAPSASVGISSGQSGALSSNRDFSVLEALQASKLQAEIDNIKANTRQMGANAENTEILNKYLPALQEGKIGLLGVNISNVKASTAKLISEDKEIQKNIEVMDKAMLKMEQDIKESQTRIEHYGTEIAYNKIRNELAREDIRSQIEQRLAAAGYSRAQTKVALDTLPYLISGYKVHQALEEAQTKLTRAQTGVEGVRAQLLTQTFYNAISEGELTEQKVALTKKLNKLEQIKLKYADDKEATDLLNQQFTAVRGCIGAVQDAVNVVGSVKDIAM